MCSWCRGYNNSVIVRHGNYLTVYSNLSQVYVKAGDRVSTRQAIGRIYSDPETVIPRSPFPIVEGKDEAESAALVGIKAVVIC